MNYIIDPDVLRAARDDARCSEALNDEIATTATHHTFLRDVEGVLQREYGRLFDQWYPEYRDGDNRQPAEFLLLQRLLNEDGSSPHLSGEWSEMGRFPECSDPVEPQLLALAAHAAHYHPILVVYGRSAAGRQKRGIYDPDVFHCVQTEIQWLHCRALGRNTVSGEWLHGHDHKLNQARAHDFENRSALWLQRCFSRELICDPQPPTRVWGTQVDVIGEWAQPDGKHLVVGECKLRVAGNEADLIDRGEIAQLVEKVIHSRTKHDRRFSDHQVHGLMISNSLGVEQLRDLESLGFGLTFVHVSIVQASEKDENWCIADQGEFTPLNRLGERLASAGTKKCTSIPAPLHRKGIVIRYRGIAGAGTLRDSETGDEIGFRKEALREGVLGQGVEVWYETGEDPLTAVRVTRA
jgi:hypothetical protein